MGTLALLSLLLALGLVTFLYRYSMIGLLAGRRLPGWLHSICRNIAPASFAALTATSLFVQDGGPHLDLTQPKPWAALVAALVAWRSGSVLGTIAAGMATLALLKHFGPLAG